MCKYFSPYCTTMSATCTNVKEKRTKPSGFRAMKVETERVFGEMERVTHGEVGGVNFQEPGRNMSEKTNLFEIDVTLESSSESEENSPVSPVRKREEQPQCARGFSTDGGHSFYEQTIISTNPSRISTSPSRISAEKSLRETILTVLGNWGKQKGVGCQELPTLGRAQEAVGKKPEGCFPVAVTDVSLSERRMKTTRGRKYCIHCLAQKRKNKTIFKCRACNVPLCIMADRLCFTEWHDLWGGQAH